MYFLFDTPSWMLSTLIVVVPSILICLGLLWIIRKKVSSETLKNITTWLDLLLASSVYSIA